MWWLSANTISVREGVLATLLFFFPCYAYSRWQRERETRIPLFATLALAYWAAFAMPLFLATPPVDPQTDARFSEPAVYSVLEMAVLGVFALGIGMKVRFRPINPANLPDIAESPGAWRYLYCAMAFGILLGVNEDWPNALGPGARQFMMSLSNMVPVAICAMLATKQMEGTATRSQRYALGSFVVARIVTGIASGWLGPVVFMGLIIAFVYISKYGRLPVKTIAVIVPAFLFLQAGKMAFRSVYWSDTQTAGIFEKAAFWMGASFKEWDAVLTHRDVRGTQELFGESIDRVALLSLSTNVLVKTPRLVPYQNGKTYSYLAATLIPRIVWPEKPTVNDANRFYQVAYGVTDKDNLDGVSIAVGCLTESFINFGWWGVVPVMFLLGLLLGLLERTLLVEGAGLLFSGIGLALLSTLLPIESQAAQYLGGLIQQIAVVFIVVLPVTRRRKVVAGRVFPLPEAV